MVKRSGRGDSDESRNTLFEDSVVRLRGLPFDSTKMDIVKFFDGKFLSQKEACFFFKWATSLIPVISDDSMTYTVIYCHIGLILGMEISNNGILMTTDYQGRSSGEAYVQFASKNDAERALEKNMKSIGHRLVGGPWLGPKNFKFRFFGRSCGGNNS